jgi:hypothetical protein
VTVAPEYIAARTVLLDALAALGRHRRNVILVGAQAVYHHTGDGDLRVAVMTTDGDLALDTRGLADDPEIAHALRSAGLTAGPNPGRWVGHGDVAVDLMVISAQANTSRRDARAARIPPHERATARVTPGIEPALVDHQPLTITALEPTDSRTFDIRVAGPAALLVAKLIKIDERLDQRETRPDRLKEKDALDAFRILQTVSTADLVAGLRTHQGDANARPVSAAALSLLSLEGLSAAGVLPRLAATAALGDPTVAKSFIALAQQLIEAAEVDGPTRE